MNDTYIVPPEYIGKSTIQKTVSSEQFNLKLHDDHLLAIDDLYYKIERLDRLMIILVAVFVGNSLILAYLLNKG
jgi:hypothetical protein